NISKVVAVRAKNPGYFLSSMSCPQHFRVPPPPLVTITWELHFEQMYILPNWFAIVVFDPSCVGYPSRDFLATALPSPNNRFAFLEKCFDALAPVSRRLQQHVQILLETDSLLERHIGAFENRLLRIPQRQRSLAAQRVHDRGEFALEIGMSRNAR